MPIEDKTRSETILANVDNLLALAIEAVDQAKVGAPRPEDLRSILDRLLLTAQSLREQLHLIDQERRNTPHQT
jgi:hypothetical protein